MGKYPDNATILHAAYRQSAGEDILLFCSDIAYYAVSSRQGNVFKGG